MTAILSLMIILI